jgi:DNA-binding transcriptional MerR regulator
MKIGEAARSTGLSPDAIRFYERRGVVPPPSRSANGYRDYTASHLAALRFARGLRDLDLPLDQVAAAARALHDGTCGDVRRSVEASVDATIKVIDERLAVLRQTARQLRELRSGLAKMNPRCGAIPGITPCDCARLVASGARRSGERRGRSV